MIRKYFFALFFLFAFLETSLYAKCPGDLSGDNHPDLTDAIIVLKMLSGNAIGMNLEVKVEDADLGDGRIGLEECIYLLQVVSNSRFPADSDGDSIEDCSDPCPAEGKNDLPDGFFYKNGCWHEGQSDEL